MSKRIQTLFNSILRASIVKGRPLHALLAFKSLLLSFPSFPPDPLSLSLLLSACRAASVPRPSFQIHAQILTSGQHSHSHLVLSSLFHSYLHFTLFSEAHSLFHQLLQLNPDPLYGNLFISALLLQKTNPDFHLAHHVFTEMPLRDLVTWNSMIAGSVRNSRPNHGLALFSEMVESGVEPDGFTFSAVLSACARTGALEFGKRVRRLMERKLVGFESNPFVVSALIDMYSKCGRIELAREIFGSVRRPSVSVCNAMMTGLAAHGLGPDAIGLVEKMDGLGIRPDSVTFLGLLMALSRSGLVGPARFYFESMSRTYSIEPRVEHYASMVDALARAGQLDEALGVIESMHIEPDSVVWRALLSGCRRHQRPDLAELAVERMSELGSGDYVMISGVYSAGKRFDWAERVWGLMRAKRVRKDRGLSWVELGGKLHQFKSGANQAHPETESIRRVLTRLTSRVKQEGFVSSTNVVTMDVDEEEKEENLSWHSEKIAVAYGVLKTTPGTGIRVSKNLASCGDCHEWMKAVSKVLCRVIVVRDRVRFHRFERGSCSCGDYW